MMMFPSSIQRLHPDSTIEMRPRVIVDQFNLVDSFAIGRFAGKYLIDPSCGPTGNEPYMIIEDGYFEANLIY